MDIDLTHLGFVATVLGLALAFFGLSGWKINNRYARHGLGIVGTLLFITGVVLLLVFSGVRLRSPISFQWPVLPSKVGAASVPNVRAQEHSTATPTPACFAEVLALRDENTKLKNENARLKKNRPPRAKAELPSACPSTTPILASSKFSAKDCDAALTNAQQLADTTAQSKLEAVNAVVWLNAEIQIGQYKASEQDMAEAIVMATLHAKSAAVAEQQAQANLTDLTTKLCVNP